MIGGEHGDFCDGLKSMWFGHRGKRTTIPVRFPYEMGVAYLIIETDGQEIVGVMEAKIGITFCCWPLGELVRQCSTRLPVTVGTRQFGEAARQNQFSFIEKSAQKLALPAVPDAGAHALDVADRQD